MCARTPSLCEVQVRKLLAKIGDHLGNMRVLLFSKVALDHHASAHVEEHALEDLTQFGSGNVAI